ncbi:MAG: acyltransferase [Bacteroidota bacterium]
MTDLNKQNAIYFPNLDGLRFIAFLLVFVNHVVACLGHKTVNPLVNKIKTDYLLNGDLGVNFFFVLSGFLITYLLLKEKEKHATINVRSFYLRRVLRIWPLYFLVLFIGLAIIPLFTTALPAGFPISNSTTIMNKNLYMFFLGNFDYVKNGISNAIVGVLWSVSIEEQFYLFWPLLLLIIPRKHLTKLFIALIAFSIYYRLFGMAGKTQNLMQHYHTFSCLSDLAMGALFAKLCGSEKFIDFFRRLNPIVIVLVYLTGFILIALRMDFFHLELTQNEYLKQINFHSNGIKPRPHQYWRSFMPVVYSLFFAFVMMEQIFAERSIFKIGKIKLFTYLGKISYGLYCFHMIALFIVVYVMMKMGYSVTVPDKKIILIEAITAFGLTILISIVSYNYFEKKFLLLKTKIAANMIPKASKKKN